MLTLSQQKKQAPRKKTYSTWLLELIYIKQKFSFARVLNKLKGIPLKKNSLKTSSLGIEGFKLEFSFCKKKVAYLFRKTIG